MVAVGFAVLVTFLALAGYAGVRADRRVTRLNAGRETVSPAETVRSLSTAIRLADLWTDSH
jgi:hypothetical protein